MILVQFFVCGLNLSSANMEYRFNYGWLISAINVQYSLGLASLLIIQCSYSERTDRDTGREIEGERENGKEIMVCYLACRIHIFIVVWNALNETLNQFELYSFCTIIPYHSHTDFHNTLL